jgi:hypothetical protein
MSHLRNLQRRFQDYLIDGSNSIEQDIVSSAGALAQHRLATYYNAYRIRLIDALALDYSALAQFLGREAFELMALDYLRQHPSTQPSLRWFGEQLPDWLRRCYQGDNPELIQELAAYEWAQASVFDATDSPALVQLEDMADFAPDSWPGLAFEFQPALKWLDLNWNVPQIEAAVDNAEELPQPRRSEHPQRWLIWRQQFKIHWRSLEVHEAWALEQACNGANFAAICEGLLEWVDADQIALVAAGFLKQWIGDQLVMRISSS